MDLPDDMMTDYLDEARRRAAAGMLYDFTENGLTEPAVEKYTSADGFRLDKQDTMRFIPANEVPMSTPTGADASDAGIFAIAQDGEASEVLSNLDLKAYCKDGYRVTEPSAAALELAAKVMEGRVDKAAEFGELEDRSGAIPA